MATKKQQRRKYQRARAHARLQGDEDAVESRDDGKDRKEQRKSAPARGSREPARPNWTRSARRAGIFAAGLFLFVLLAPLGGTKPSPVAAAFQAAMFFVFLVPFGYLTDGFIYNRWLKRQRG
jgi:hypothetical protein